MFQATVASPVQNTAATSSCATCSGAGFRLGGPTRPMARAPAQNSSSQGRAPTVVRKVRRSCGVPGSNQRCARIE